MENRKLVNVFKWTAVIFYLRSLVLLGLFIANRTSSYLYTSLVTVNIGNLMNFIRVKTK